MYDFSTPINRRGTACIKWDVTEPFGTTEPVTPFWIADMDFATLPEVTEALHARCDHPIFGYSIAPEGAIEAVCGWYARRHGFDFRPEDVLCGIGVVTMIRYMLDAMTAPGDRVIVMSPVYDAFYKVVTGAGRELYDVPLKCEGGRYCMDLDGVEEALKSGARCVLFCNPHNPVGRVWTREELTELAALLARYDAWIISDEVHGDIELSGPRYTPMGCIESAKDRCAVCTAISKTFNLAGLHQSCIVIQNAEMREKVDGLLHSAWIMGPNVMAYHAMKAAYTHGDRWLDELRAYLLDNAKYVVDELAARAPEIRTSVPQGGYLMWVDLRLLGLTSAEASASLVENSRVGISSGRSYGPQCEGFIRLNIGCPRSTLKVAVDALVKLAESRRVEHRPVATITMADGREMKLELYPELAPNTVASFIHLARLGCFDRHGIERIEPGYVVDVSFTAFGREECKYLIANEAPVAGGVNPLPAAPGYVCMGGYPEGIAGGEFFFPLAESPRLEGKYPVFGRITEGMELLREWAQAELAGTFYPMEPPVPTTKPATPIVMESVTVDTFGVDYPAPVTYPAPIKPPAW